MTALVTISYEFTYPDERWLTKVMELELEKLASKYNLSLKIIDAVAHK